MLTKKNRNYIFLALSAFLGLCLEFVLLQVEQRINGLDMSQVNISQLIHHWLIIIPVWLIISIVVIFLSKKKSKFNVFEPHATPSRWMLILGITLPVLFAVVLSILNGGPGFIKSYKAFPAAFFSLQYIYYLFEMLLAGLIISLSQQAVELALTWGLGHYITKGDIAIALVALVLGIFFGLIFNWVGKDLKKAWPLMYLVFSCLA